ncbi:adenosylcobinamide-GDP ribazoletransferase [Lysobacter cavernae]|uniref:Adenosylcobinamide-GDP ribazoletransferase n=1 Tax=Lysobacter cavernae TaxID=1685901 RepID=A0ABV7RPS3_9GAMM
MIDGLLAAIGFLTRVPVPPRVFAVAGVQSRSLAWYPLVGALLGGVLCALAWGVQGWPPLLGAAVVLVAWVLLTGALHLDGLADSADAWVGGLGGNPVESRERTLTIMKDPRSGPVGVVAVVLVLLLKFAALASIPASSWWALLLAPTLARAALVTAFLGTPYVRSGGLGSGLVAAPRVACWAALVATLVLCGAFGWRGGIALAVALLVFAWWRRACLRRLAGMTGDTCGALTELVEAAVLVAVIAVA